jgi:hypothetical protein
MQTKYDKDVSSIENIAEAMLHAISGEKGQKRDWKRFENLFLPTAQLNAAFHNGDSSWVKVNTLKEFIDKAGTWYEDNGFKEYSFKNKIDSFGNIAHVFQSYGAEFSGGKEKGINSLQFVYDKDRWWIVNVLWDSETVKDKIPKEYLE